MALQTGSGASGARCERAPENGSPEGTHFLPPRITALDANPTVYTHSQFAFPTCLTCHTWQGYLEMGMKPAAFAVWRICWSRTQKSATPIVVRIVSFDNGGGNIVELGSISSANWPAGIETS